MHINLKDIGIGLGVSIASSLVGLAFIYIPFVSTALYAGIFIFSQKIIHKKLDLASYLIGGVVLPICFIDAWAAGNFQSGNSRFISISEVRCNP
jgi:hypothetical protein